MVCFNEKIKFVVHEMAISIARTAKAAGGDGPDVSCSVYDCGRCVHGTLVPACGLLDLPSLQSHDTLLLASRYSSNDLIGECTISLFDLIPPDDQKRSPDLQLIRRLQDSEGNPVNDGGNDGKEVITVSFLLCPLCVRSCRSSELAVD